MVDCSCVIPAYDSAAVLERTLAELHACLTAAGLAFELIVVDDGSRDDTADRAARALTGLAGPHLLLRQPRNLGKGAAVRRGVLAARGRAVAFTDADLPYQPAFLVAACRLIDRGAAHLVIGDRTLPASAARRQPPVRALASRVFHATVERAFGAGLGDTQCGLKVFAAPAVGPLFADLEIAGFAFDLAVLLRARALGLTVRRLEVTQLAGGPSTLHLGRHGAEMLRDLVRIRRDGGYRQKLDSPRAVLLP